MNPKSTNKKKGKYFKTFLAALYAFSSLIYGYILIDGLSYYFTAYADRPHHPDYRALRPAGERGHLLGIIGSAMMVLLLLYSVRKRFKIFRKWGAINKWLNIHIYFGIFGPLLVILHSTFKLNGIISVSFWSMVAIALSGVLGRYIYVQIPRSISGVEMGMNEVHEQKKIMTEQLVDKYQITQEFIERLEQNANGKQLRDKNTLSLIFSLIVDDFTRKKRIKRYVKHSSVELNLPKEQINNMIDLIYQKSLLDRKIALWNKIQVIFHYWHVIHKPFAYVMLLIMLVHVIVAILMGYTWFV